MVSATDGSLQMASAVTAVARMTPDSEPPDCPESRSSSNQFSKLTSPLTPFSAAAAFQSSAASRATKGLDAFKADLYRLVQQLPTLVQGVKKLIAQGVTNSHHDMAPLFVDSCSTCRALQPQPLAPTAG